MLAYGRDVFVVIFRVEVEKFGQFVSMEVFEDVGVNILLMGV